MGISVEGQKCPVCGSYIFDNDDLVFCPECGAPHHRDCYAALGHCAYEDRHGTPEGYKKPSPVSKENNESEIKAAQNTDGSEDKKLCRFCGAEIPNGENTCPNCQRPNINGAYMHFGSPVMMDPLGGVNPDEMIDDVPAKEVKDFVVVNTGRYLPRFKAMNDKGKKSWNWGAFLFPHIWFFYRKMFLMGIVFFILTVTASLFTLSYSTLLNSFPDEVKTSTTALMKYLTENMESINLTPVYLATVGLVGELIIRIVAGFMGDRVYRKTVLEGIKKIKTEGTELDTPLELELRRKGGVSLVWGLVGIFALDWVVMLIYAFL